MASANTSKKSKNPAPSIAEAPTEPPEADDAVPVSFALFLARRSEEVTKRKGERTRDKLKAAAASLLEKVGYRDLRVTDINETAGVSNALFYVYFQTRRKSRTKFSRNFSTI